MAEKEIRVAMIGGRGHQLLAHGFGKIEGLRCIALAADDYDDAVKKYHKSDYAKDVPYFDHYEKMLDQLKPDIVSIGARPACAGAPIIAALERGIHVVSDKPIANTREELSRMEKLVAAKPGLLLLTEFDFRARPACRAMEQAVRSGEIGEVVLVQGQKSYKFGDSRPDFYKTRECYPGSMMFVGCHLIDLTYWVTQLRFASIQGLQGNLSSLDYGTFEDHAVALFRMENGGTTVIHVDYLRPKTAPTHGDDRLRVAGTKGVIEMREDRCILITAEKEPHELPVIPEEHPIATEVVKALRGKGGGALNNKDSLYIADVLLSVREALDAGCVIPLL